MITQPPDLQAMVAAFGTYSAIPPAAWVSYDRQIATWLASIRNGSVLPQRQDDPNASALFKWRKSQMDISDQISSSGFIKVHDLANGPRRAVIADVRPGRFKGPDMELQDGNVLSLNATNMRTLANAWGTETDGWIGKEIELYVGKTQFQGETRDSVLVKPISPPVPLAERPLPKPKPKPASSAVADLNDEIPF